MLSYPIVVSQLSFNFLCLLLLYSIYLCGLVGDIPDGNGKIANLSLYSVVIKN
jgi:hypothetical protein